MTTTPTPAPNPIPPINTDAWADYMISVLTTGGTVRDEDLAALTGVQTQQVRRVIIALAQSFNAESSGGGAVSQAYVDNGDSNTLATALAAVAAQTVAYTAADTTVLTAAKTYTDEQVAGGGGGGTDVTQAYVDAQDVATLASAVADLQSGDATTLAAAQAYTDAHSGSGGVTQDYVDAGDAESVASANNNTTTAVAAGVTQANTYTDNSAVALSTALAGTMDSKITSYDSTTVQPGLAATLAAAEAYTDAQGGGSGGVTKTYVDTQDGSTLANAESYADTKDAAVLSNAESYAVAQAANAQTAAIAAAATDATTKANNAQANAISAAATDATTKANNAITAAASGAAALYTVADTGWVAVAAPSGYASSMQYRKRGTRVTMRGALQISTGNIAAVSNLFAFAAAARPTQTMHYILVGVGAGVCNVTIDSSGNFTIVAAPTVAGNALWLDTIDFYTD